MSEWDVAAYILLATAITGFMWGWYARDQLSKMKGEP